MKTLDCGHVDDWGGLFGCRTREGMSLCNACADARGLAAFLAPETTRAMHYVSSDGRHVTSWGGGVLATILNRSELRVRYTPSGGRYEWQSFQAVDELGRKWSGQGPGTGMYARLTRMKGK